MRPRGRKSALHFRIPGSFSVNSAKLLFYAPASPAQAAAFTTDYRRLEVGHEICNPVALRAKGPDDSQANP